MSQNVGVLFFFFFLQKHIVFPKLIKGHINIKYLAHCPLQQVAGALISHWTLVFGISISIRKALGETTEHTCTLLPFTPQAVLSPLALLVHSNVIFFLSLKMFAFFNDLSVLLYLFLLSEMSCCTESPLSHSGLSNQEHISLRSPLPCHQ